LNKNIIYNIIQTFSLITFICTVSFSQEIDCTNEIDDDGDGLIDSFDPDCDCVQGSYNAQCDIECKTLPINEFDFSMKINWESDLISNEFIFPSIVTGDINSDGETEVITCHSFNRGTEYDNGISIFNGSNGTQSNSFSYHNDPGFKDFSHLVIGKANNDDLEASIFILDNNSFTIKSFSENGSLNWESSPLFDVQGTLLNITDFNQDGISELYIGRQIFNAETGVLLASGTEGSGCNKGVSIFDQCNFSHSIAADFLPNFGLELAAGNTVYEIEITNLNGEAGNTINPILAPFEVKDGLTSTADIDGDGFLDVINVRDINYSDGGAIWIWNPRTRQVIAQGISGQGGGIPCIGNIDDDCTPEIAVIYLNQMKVYKYDGSSTLNELYVLNIDENSANTSPTMFDFNLDGRNEIVLRDESSIKLIEGESGLILSQLPILAGTGNESPIIADIDNDNQAEILTHGSVTDQNKVQLFAIETGSSNWAPARSIWNQVGYYVTNVNDNLSIPISPQNIAQSFGVNCISNTCPKVYNNFNVQATIRNQDGCVQLPGFDLIVNAIALSCDKDSIGVQFSITINGNPDSPIDSISFDFFNNNLSNPNSLPIKNETYPFQFINLNATDTFVINLPFQETENIFISTKVLSNEINIECDLLNNIDSLKFNSNDLNLGPDILKCRDDIVTIFPNESYASYLWNNNSQDSIFTTSEEGEFILQVSNYCNNTFIDTILIQNQEPPSLEIDSSLQLCLGDSIIFEIDQYQTILWEASGDFDCIDCSKVTYKTSNSDTIFLTYSDGVCIYKDSIFVNLINQERVFIFSTICKNDTYEFIGKEFNEEGVYEILNLSCDSLFILDLKVEEPSFEIQTFEICQNDSIIIDGKWLKSDTTFNQNFLTNTGCDSIIETRIIEHITIFTFDTISMCDTDSIFYFNEWLTESGIFKDTIISRLGCDSIHSLYLKKLTPEESNINVELCEGDSIEIGNTYFSDQGSYTVNLSNQFNCDSIINIEISFAELLIDSFYYSVCENDSVNVNGTFIIQSTEFIDTILNNSCKKIEYYNVEFLENSLIENSHQICQGDSILIHENYIKQEGLITTILQSADGCDSIINSFIEVIPIDHSYNLEFDCINSIFKVELLNIESWNVLWNDGSTDVERTLQIDSSYAIELTSNKNMSCVNLIDIDLNDFIFDNIDFQLNDRFILLGDSVTVELPIDTNVWNIKWKPSNEVKCDTCIFNTISVDQDTEFEIILTNDLGCEELLQFTIHVESTVESNIYIPNVFSPNFDGNNDTWDIIALEDKIESLIIYDRWGNNVASWENVSTVKWDGTMNNIPLELGVYVYKMVLTIGEDRIYKSGNITLIR